MTYFSAMVLETCGHESINVIIWPNQAYRLLHFMMCDDPSMQCMCFSTSRRFTVVHNIDASDTCQPCASNLPPFKIRSEHVFAFNFRQIQIARICGVLFHSQLRWHHCRPKLINNATTFCHKSKLKLDENMKPA